jgi:hypothetical protein
MEIQSTRLSGYLQSSVSECSLSGWQKQAGLVIKTPLTTALQLLRGWFAMVYHDEIIPFYAGLAGE